MKNKFKISSQRRLIGPLTIERKMFMVDMRKTIVYDAQPDWEMGKAQMYIY